MIEFMVVTCCQPPQVAVTRKEQWCDFATQVAVCTYSEHVQRASFACPTSHLDSINSMMRPIITSLHDFYLDITHRIHVWYIYQHLVDLYGKCRHIYHTWILWVIFYHIPRLKHRHLWLVFGLDGESLKKNQAWLPIGSQAAVYQNKTGSKSWHQ